LIIKFAIHCQRILFVVEITPRLPMVKNRLMSLSSASLLRSFLLLSLVSLSETASAQSSACADGQKYLAERQAIVARINSLGKKKVDPAKACQMFGSLANNGAAVVKWADTNKDWCQIPEQFVAGLKADHVRSVSLRGQACKAAQQQAIMMKRAREQAKQGGGQGGGGLLGGGGLTGEFKTPQGAL
jgi:hypothetical protein